MNQINHFVYIPVVKMVKFQCVCYFAVKLVSEIFRQQILHLEFYTPVFLDTTSIPHRREEVITMYYFNHITMMIRLVIIHSFAIVQFLFTVSSKRVPLFQRTSLNLFSLVVSIYSVQFSHSVVSDSFRPHESQHARPPCPSPTPGVYPNPCPLSR